MKHNIKFNHKNAESFFEALGIEDGHGAINTLNEKIVEVFQKTKSHPELKDSKSYLAENLANSLTEEELLFLATEELCGRTLTAKDWEKARKITITKIDKPGLLN